MRKSRKRSVQLGEKSLTIAFFFIIIVILLVGFSIALKVFLLFRAAKFDGEHQFIIELRTPSQEQLLALDPDSNSAAILSLSGNPQGSLARYVEVPSDTVITLASSYDSLYSLAQDMLFHPSSHVDLNIIDRIRLFLFVNNIKPTDITEYVWKTGGSNDKELTQLFTDHTAYAEDMSIAVVNASGESGVGNRIAEYLSHIGMNVISVTTSEDLQDHTTLVYSGKEGYTTTRLAHIFNTQPHILRSPTISDLTIVVGKDTAASF